MASSTSPATNVYTGTLTGTNAGGGQLLLGNYQLVLSGTWTGSVQPQLSTDPPSVLDADATWVPLAADTTGTPVAITQNCVLPLYSSEVGNRFRLKGNLASGTCGWRVSQ